MMSTVPNKYSPRMDENFANLLLESMAEGVFTLDDSGVIEFWNPAMEKITGYTAHEALGRECTMLDFNRCVSRSCPSGIRECGIFEHGLVDGKECSLTHRDGHEVPVLKSARVIRDGHGRVKGVVETVTDLSELERARRTAEEAVRRLGEMSRLDRIIGKSHEMARVFSAIRAAAASDATILLQGESGTGKELAASAIHFNGPRSDMPFVTVNCVALSETLLESELFGHVRGAFTGAVRDRTGRFESADGGTIFLDEIGEISPFIQTKLLRVLQEKEIERVGESRRRKIDIRIIAATNKDLGALINGGNFREDLYYRLKVFPIELPPLRKRREDIPLLADHFIAAQNEKTGKRIRGFSSQAMRIAMDYPWPGNVRELENAVEHAFVLCNGERIEIFDLPVEVRQYKYGNHPRAASGSAVSGPRSNRGLSRENLLELLEECGWNKAEASRRLGLSRTAVWKYMKKWNIPLKRF